MRNVFSIQDDDDQGRGPALEDPRDEKAEREEMEIRKKMMEMERTDPERWKLKRKLRKMMRKKKKKEPLTREDYRKRLQELLRSYENKPLSFAERRIIEGMKSKSLI